MIEVVDPQLHPFGDLDLGSRLERLDHRTGAPPAAVDADATGVDIAEVAEVDLGIVLVLDGQLVGIVRDVGESHGSVEDALSNVFGVVCVESLGEQSPGAIWSFTQHQVPGDVSEPTAVHCEVDHTILDFDCVVHQFASVPKMRS